MDSDKFPHLEQLARALIARHHTVAVAESCTGGLLGGALTSQAGSSAYFIGGILAYANSVKIELLGVSEDLIRTEGAVSAPVAMAMARGACTATGADWALATTGIAGPGGGTPDKPVGTVWIGIVGPAVSDSVCLGLSGSRREIRENTVEAAIDVLLTHL